MLHFNHDSKQETNEGHASAAGNADTSGVVGAPGATGAGAPNIPTPPEGYQQATFASTLPTVCLQTAN